jgi:hypothetical protein
MTLSRRASMDDKTVYLELREKMEALLAYINTSQERPWGACFANGTCTMTTLDNCRGAWHQGVECLVMGGGLDYALFSQELLERMRGLLEQVHAKSAAEVSPCTFEAGGRTYTLEMTPQECEVVEGVTMVAKA